MGDFSYPPFINNAAALIGKMRDVYNTEMNEDAAHFKRGDRSEYVNILGIKGEMIAQYYAFTRGVSYTAAKFLAQKPLGEPDIVIGDKRFDVKAIRPDAPDLLVNSAAHAKAKNISDYWFVQCFDTNHARFWFYSHDEVSSWPEKDVKYSMARHKRIADINDEKGCGPLK